MSHVYFSELAKLLGLAALYDKVNKMANDIDTLNEAIAALQSEQAVLGTAVNGIVAALQADIAEMSVLRGQLATAIASPANSDTAALAAASTALAGVTSNLAGYASALASAVPVATATTAATVDAVTPAATATGDAATVAAVS